MQPGSPPAPNDAPTPPPEAVLYLRRVVDGDGDRFEVRDEEGVLGGLIDRRDGTIDARTPRAAALIARVVPNVVAAATPRRGRRNTRRFGGRGRRSIPLVVALRWSDPADRRLYVFRLDADGDWEDLGSVDTETGHVAEVVAGRASTLRYCASLAEVLDAQRRDREPDQPR